MSKRFLTLAAVFMLAASAFAVPAKRVKRQVQQPDGSVLTVMLRGDENLHYTSTEDGQPLVQREDGARWLTTRAAVAQASWRSSATTRQRRRRCARSAWSVRSSATPTAWRVLRSATLWTLRASRLCAR